jgi:hypothetical protein
MKAKFVICCALALALIGLSCTPESVLEISVTGIDDEVLIENVGNIGCLVFVTSPEGDQQFQLAVGKSVTVTNISKPVEVSAVSLATG